MTYQRNGRYADLEENTGAKAPLPGEGSPQEAGEKVVKVDGYNQVLEMLRIADDEFRDSLLRRVGAADPELARRLRAELDL